MDSGIVETLLGVEQCDDCQAHLGTIAYRLYGAISAQKLRNKSIDPQMLHMSRALVSASSAQPIQGNALAQLLDCSDRTIKDIAARLNDEWRLPAIASRRPPYGYFIAANAEELLEWGRVIRSQAITELVRYYHLLKTAYPEFAGQQSLDFVNTVSSELTEAIR